MRVKVVHYCPPLNTTYYGLRGEWTFILHVRTKQDGMVQITYRSTSRWNKLHSKFFLDKLESEYNINRKNVRFFHVVA